MLFLFLIALMFWGIPEYVWAQESPSVVINEIMWAKDEYIELKNTTDTDVDLNGWSIGRQKTSADAEDEDQVLFMANDVIQAHGFFLVESSESATTITGNKIDGTLGLVDDGALLRL